MSEADLTGAIQPLNYLYHSDFRRENDYGCCHIWLQNELRAFSEYDTQKFHSNITNYFERVGDI